MKNLAVAAVIAMLFTFASPFSPRCLAQSPAQDTSDLPKLGVGVRLSSLGAGVEAGTALTGSTNLRVGFNAFGISHGLDKDGVHYDGRLALRSVEAHLDWFFAGPLRLSPGLLVYNDNHGTATASVPGGQTFSLGGNTYTSDPTNPVGGNATLGANKIAPMLLLGVGNLLPRNGSRFSIQGEFGIAYQGSPSVALNLTGSACDSQGNFCQNVATNSSVQSSVQAEQTKLNSKLTPFKYYPVLSIGLSYRFK